MAWAATLRWGLLALAIAPALVQGALAGGSVMFSDQERFGVGVARQYGDVTDYDVAGLRVGWYMDWSYSAAPARPGGIAYMQLVRTLPDGSPPDWASLEAAVRANPGAWWLVGNEPDARPGVMDSQPPASYAAAYHSIYTFIKALDGSAHVGPGGVIQPTPLRLRYLDMALDAYEAQHGAPLPADFWATHVQILQEDRDDWGAGIPQGIGDDTGRLYTIQDNGDPAIFEQLVRELRAWMAARGLRDKPLVISEYGVLMPSLYLCYCDDYAIGDAIVVDFMRRSFDFLLSASDAATGCPGDGNRLVQRWSWYSLNDKPYDVPPYGIGYNGALYDFSVREYPGKLTLFGRAFSGYLARLLSPYHLYLPMSVQQK